MSDVKWTNEQKQAIEEKGENILVAAAAGSGKTAVLVERIIHKVIYEKTDIDKILVVTFTNAAASEMRERILEAIYKKIEEEPENKNLQRQVTLLNKASICTIHSFCLDVIRNYFYEIDTSANFRVGDTAEIELLKKDVLEDIFEEKYIAQDEGFIKLIETYTSYRGDEALQDLILNIYKYIQSSPFPQKWLEEKLEMFTLSEEQDFSKTIWGKIIIENVLEEISECIAKLRKIKNETEMFYELEKYTKVLQDDIINLENIIQKSDSWDVLYNLVNQISWLKWPVDKKVTLDLKNVAKEKRDKVKKQFNSIATKMVYNSNEATQNILQMKPILKELVKIVLEFEKEFSNSKREKNIIDFNDIEHFALKILVNTQDGKIEPSKIAKIYKEKFEEIAIDEYQDSNLVQEYILKSISKGNNLFMVGDVKQSIYKFRQARPELFLEKYSTYKLKEEIKNKPDGIKIQLFKNFRSRENVLTITNLVFENIMSKSLGDIEYKKNEFLNYGANFPNPLEENISHAGIAELMVLDLKEKEEPTLEFKSDQEENNENEEEQQEKIEDVVLEAKMVANKIKQILSSGYQVYDRKKGYRNITYKDICVLLRATSTAAPIYEKEISNLGFPVFSDTSAEYLSSIEIQTILSLLKIIDNPMQDIPLVTVLRSMIGGFTDNDLVEIRLISPKGSFYEAMLKARIQVGEGLKNKINTLLEKLENWRKEEKYLPLDELIWKIYSDTGFYHYVSLMQNGLFRQANLKMLFERAKQYEEASFKGLFNFINFIDKIKTSSGDLGSAKLIGENENVIRIMSIHKSKGLEFPVVFLSGTGKRFNMQDLNQPILLHQELGFGPKYIDSERKIEFNTLAKEAIKFQTQKETISEEMRVLYVALTRAKEKLIITGMTRDFEKSIKEKEELISTYQLENRSSSKINSNLVKKYKTYLDWLELVYLYNKDIIEQIIDLKVYKRENINVKENEDISKNVDIIKEMECKPIKEIQKQIEEKLQWKYEFIESSKIPTKTSVTKLKELQMENVISLEELNEETDITLTAKPKFLQESLKLTSAQKGTLLHLCVQKMDEKIDYTNKEIADMVQELYQKEIITKQELEAIDIRVLEKYTKSELWQELKKAKEIHKEQPFYINIPANKIYENAQEDEKILVQGIIDLYYINEKGQLILVDYKTDYIEKGKEVNLEEKYKLQLELYKQALEQALGKKVDKAIIWHLSR